MSTQAAPAPVFPVGTWVVDPSHSRIGFAVRHLGIATIRGEFTEFEGTLEIARDFAHSRVRGTVKTASVDTNEAKRDGHLRSGDFFDVENYPELTFESRRIEATGDDTFSVVGDLTLHGVTNEIQLTAELMGTEVDPYGNERLGLEAAGELSRGAYGMKFNQVLGSGNVAVSDKVRLVLDISAAKQA